MLNKTHAGVMATSIAAQQVYEQLDDSEMHWGCACIGKRHASDPACQCAMRNYFKDGDDWYKVTLSIEKVSTEGAS